MSIIKMNFNTEIAKLVGTDAAIIYSNIEYWVEHNKLNNKHFYEGNYWTFNSVEAFRKYFDYLSNSQIKTCLSKLEKSDLILVGNFNKVGYDRTKWYCIPLESTISEKSQMDLSEIANPLDENRQPIPNYKTDKKQYKDSVSQIFFRDSFWNSYENLKDKLKDDSEFVKNFKGVDLKAYIEDVLQWSEKGNKTTDNGWYLTLRKWMREGKKNGKLQMLPEIVRKQQGHTNH